VAFLAVDSSCFILGTGISFQLRKQRAAISVRGMTIVLSCSVPRFPCFQYSILVLCLPDDSSSSEASGWSNKLSFQDIDHGQSDPQMCSMYAAEIYEHLRRAEVCP
jgi:type III secretory pathway component EscV